MPVIAAEFSTRTATEADLTEGAANRLSVDTRQQIGINSPSLAGQSQTAILGLVG